MAQVERWKPGGALQSSIAMSSFTACQIELKEGVFPTSLCAAGRCTP
jgi:hypothetical protein